MPATKPTDTREIDPVALRARAEAQVVHLADVLRRDMTAGREALSGILAEPAQAIPILVNGESRFLVRGRLLADPLLGDGAFKNGGDPREN